MSSVVGHVIAAAVVTSAGASPQATRRARLTLLTLAAAAALAPDLDVVWMAIRPQAGDVHRGLTHGLPFVAAVAAALSAAFHGPARTPPTRLFLVLLGAGLSHLVLDALMGAGAPIRPLAPFSDRAFQAPVTLVPVAYYARSTAAYALPGFWIRNAVAGFLEILILAPWLVVLSPRQGPRARLLAAGLAVAAVATTVAVYR